MTKEEAEAIRQFLIQGAFAEYEFHQALEEIGSDRIGRQLTTRIIMKIDFSGVKRYLHNSGDRSQIMVYAGTKGFSKIILKLGSSIRIAPESIIEGLYT